jgi:hypothetical protein
LTVFNLFFWYFFEETPRAEQDSNDPSMRAHRQFDNPFMLHTGDKKKVVDRGWASGQVGWGVQGYNLNLYIASLFQQRLRSMLEMFPLNMLCL